MKAQAIVGRIEKAVLTIYQRENEQFEPQYTLTVPFNPSRIRYLASAEKIVQNSYRQGAMGMAETRYNQVAKVITGQMSFQLMFDKVELADSFMWEVTQTLTNPTPTAVIKDAASMIKGQTSLGPPSVKDAMSGLSAVLMSGADAVGFKWGNIDFVGTLTEVQMVFTMFSTRGEPVRGTVDMRLSEIGNYADFGKAKTNPFQAFFKDNVADAQNVTRKVGNLVNLNL